LLADKFYHFGYCTEFTLSFIRRIEDEIKLANVPFDWDGIDDTNQIKTGLRRKIKSYTFGNDHEFHWKLDPGEKGW
jgi:hypothetical protein